MQIVKFIFVLLALLGVQIIKAQNVGIGNNDPKAKLDVSGDLILKSVELILNTGNTLDLDKQKLCITEDLLFLPTAFENAGMAIFNK